MKELYVCSITYIRYILTAHYLNHSEEINFAIYDDTKELLKFIKANNYCLIFGCIFDKRCNHSPSFFSTCREYLRLIIKLEIDFKIIGDREDLERLQKDSPPLYDKILPHIIWKGEKRGSNSLKSL